MSDDAQYKQTVAAIAPIAGYAFVASGVILALGSFITAFGSRASLLRNLEPSFSDKLKTAAQSLASSVSIPILLMAGLALFTACLYLRREDANRGWFGAIAVAGVTAFVIAAATVYVFLATLFGAPGFDFSPASLKFGYILEWVSVGVLAAATLLVTLRIWKLALSD